MRAGNVSAFSAEPDHFVQWLRELQPPPLKWKYHPIAALFGYHTALKASRVLPRLRAQATCNWDKFLYDWRHRTQVVCEDRT